ncbi:Unknown protein, partial [Striga hermonthica]
KVNLSKSSIFFSVNTPQEIKSEICTTLMGITPQTSSTYLGLPLGIGRSKTHTFAF